MGQPADQRCPWSVTDRWQPSATTPTPFAQPLPVALSLEPPTVAAPELAVLSIVCTLPIGEPHPPSPGWSCWENAESKGEPVATLFIPKMWSFDLGAHGPPPGSTATPP